ncbi:MAG: hypothetical protein ACI9SC_001542 [Gammaproteobacteria bacterium]|jgi:uncharacterized protein YigA (DUF484 family)
MSIAPEDDYEMPALSAGVIAEYLRAHPEFFNEYPDLLTDIKVPHASGDAISLVERQLTALREQNDQTRKRMHELIEIARQNEELAKRMHQLALTLMDAAEPKDIFSTLYDNLRKNFLADKVMVRLFADPSFVDTFAGDEFAGSQVAQQSLFKSIIDKRMPISGRLKRQQQVFLFGDDGDEIASAVLVPLHGDGWGGIMAIGSFNADRFQESMGVELLANMGEILSFILKPWVIEK